MRLALDCGGRKGHAASMSLFPEDAPYRVLARKYRPGDFDSLIGQQAVVTTLANAIRCDRLAQAWLLTGVRGVGKTSTARIIAKALNCIGADGNGGPTVKPCGVCPNCIAIAAGQHIDVVEIDAASNTGVDNIREIIEAVRYAPVSARNKIYIIDEVHMLSKGAFNALLKTLEEPPPHVKFIFATTEVQKVPATILSRCQRFDLKRVPAELLASHFARICELEHGPAEAEAIALIARAAEGSVRDGLSILDQAIALAGDGAVTAMLVRDMLGLAEHGRLTSLLGAILAADAGATLRELDSARDSGVEPDMLLSGLLDLVHMVSRAKLAGAVDPMLAESDAAAVSLWAGQLSFPSLNRLWQLLLKGHEEVVRAPVPQQAADMAVLRLVHAAGLPDPERLLKLLQDGAVAASDSAPNSAPAAPAPASNSAPPVSPPASALPSDAESLVALFSGREARMYLRLHDDAAIAIDAPGRLYLGEVNPLPAGFASEVKRCLDEWTATAWIVDSGPPRAGHESLQQREERAEAERYARAEAEPLVRLLLQAFPGAEIRAPRPPRPLPTPLIRSAAK